MHTLRWVYDAAQTSLPRVQASGEGEAEALARLHAQQASLDPFELNPEMQPPYRELTEPIQSSR